ncbi:hypothetical protein PM082_006318 [Marasmius tenuissimus]|nr:hypothetical protein PM082_006318 [Marasmius tenuissimus]
MQLTQQKFDYADAKELWVDSTRGEIVLGPEGPKSDIKWNRWDFKMENLPLTSELLQEDVFMRFMASQEADLAFVFAISVHVDCDVNVPESFHRPTIFSTLTATPIAFANNVWTGRKGAVERKVLEKGLTRFRLDEDTLGWFSVGLNEDVREAWLSQSLNIFHSRGMLLEDDVGAYKLVYPWVFLSGDLDETPSKTQRRRQQPIYLFVHPPPRNPLDDKTERLHFWSFHEDGQHRLLPESCRDFGLPLELKPGFSGWQSYSISWPTSSYQLIRQYHTLRGFDPTTPDFARHLGYGDYDFQLIHHADRFMEVDQEHSDNLDGSVIGNDSECLSHTMDQELAEHPIFMASNQAGSESIISSICAPNKRQKMHMGFGGAERNNPELELRHKNNTTNDRDLAMDEASRPVQPLPSRFSPFADPVNLYPQHHSHPPSGYQSQVAPPCYHSNQPPYHYPSHPAGPLSGDVLSALPDMNMSLHTTSHVSSSHLQSQGWPELSSNTAAATYFDALPPFNAYSSAEIANSASDLTTSMMDLNHTHPSAYPGVNAIADAPRYNIGADQSTGWLGTSLVQTLGTVNTFCDGPAHPSASYSTPALTSPSVSAVPIMYSQHDVVPTSHMHDPSYPSLFPGSFAPQEHWNPAVVHHDPSPFSPPGATCPIRLLTPRLTFRFPRIRLRVILRCKFPTALTLSFLANLGTRQPIILSSIHLILRFSRHSCFLGTRRVVNLGRGTELWGGNGLIKVRRSFRVDDVERIEVSVVPYFTDVSLVCLVSMF